MTIDETTHQVRSGWADKGFAADEDRTAESLRGAELFDGSFRWPVMTLRESALAHNLATLAAFCAAHDLSFAPHGKTTMAPRLWQRQLDAGAWGITVATVDQAVIARRAGVGRVLIANEVLDLGALTWLAHELATDPSAELWCYVDSPVGVSAAAASAAAGGARALPVLVELGYPGGRTGCRSVTEALALAHVVAATPGVSLAGVAGYEGGCPDVASAADHLRQVQSLWNQALERGLMPAEAIVTAGGSSYFDVVADVWATGWRAGSRPRRVLRSGAYVSHDDGVYTTKTPFTRIDGSLAPAIEVWAQVISAGDPGRVIAGMGKRDAPYDEGLPVPLRVRKRQSTVVAPLDGVVVEKLDDHHAYLLGDAGLEPGDLVAFGISHPCTAFDKWRLLPVLSDDHRVVDLVRTWF